MWRLLLTITVACAPQGQAAARPSDPPALLGGGSPTSPEAPELTLLTVGPGVELYARFGHAALLVRWPDGYEAVFNYGYTDFADSALIWSFLRGRARFWVAESSLMTSIREYQRDDRSLYRQVLQLSPDAARRAAWLLVRQARPENRYYVYHHFEDNCSTRLRDVLDQVTAGALRRQLGGREGPPGSLRSLVRRGFASELGLLVGVDLLLGRTLDRRLSQWEAVFLPRVLSDALMQVRLADCGKHGEAHPCALADTPDVIYRRRARAPDEGHDPLAGVKLLWTVAGGAVLLGLLTILLARRRSRWAGLPVVLAALPLALLGLVVWSVVAMASLPELRENELVLVLWPLDLALIWPGVRWLRGRLWAGRLLRGYLGLRLVALALVLLGHVTGVLVQQPLAWLALDLTLVLSTFLAARSVSPVRPVRTPGEAPCRSMHGS